MSSRWTRWRRKIRKKLRPGWLRGLEAKVSGSLQLQLLERIRVYRELLDRGGPLPSLAETEFKVFSQNGEDGILLYLLALCGWEHRRFLEIGIQDGWECNCSNLAKHLGWEGWFIEGNPADAELAREHFRVDPHLQHRNVKVVSSYVTLENLNGMLAEQGVTGQGMGGVDLFSLDIDGMDWWIWQALESLQPRVVVVEYNSAFGPERSVTVPYQPVFDWKKATSTGLYFGASLQAFVKLGREKGYRFVGCNSTGVNAFFVREDIAPPLLAATDPAVAFRENFSHAVHGNHERQFQSIAHLELVEV